jgi:hypothetical protein
MSLRKLGRGLRKVGKAIAPVAGATIGFALGGPAGAALGGAIGNNVGRGRPTVKRAVTGAVTGALTGGKGAALAGGAKRAVAEKGLAGAAKALPGAVASQAKSRSMALLGMGRGGPDPVNVALPEVDLSGQIPDAGVFRIPQGTARAGAGMAAGTAGRSILRRAGGAAAGAIRRNPQVALNAVSQAAQAGLNYDVARREQRLREREANQRLGIERAEFDRVRANDARLGGDREAILRALMQRMGVG